MTNYDDDKLLDDTSEAIFKKLADGTSITSLPKSEQVVVRIYAAQGAIDNGGLGYFFGNDWEDHPDYSVFIDAYRIIGVGAVADAIEATVTAFGLPTPHLDCEGRNDWLIEHGTDDDFSRWDDEALDQSETVWSKLAHYVRLYQGGTVGVKQTTAPDA